MEETYTTKAIILNRVLFREVDSRTTIYTLDRGKLELVARGVKKLSSKLAGHLEPISLSNIMVIRGKQFDYVGGAVNENCYFNIKNDLERLHYAGQAISLFNKLIRGNDQTDAGALFGLLKEYLDTLNYELKIKNYELLYSFFIFKLLVILGYRPELYNCVACKNRLNKPEGIKFYLDRGGIICANCSEKNTLLLDNSLTISENCVKVLRLVINNNLVHLKNLQIDKKSEKEICNIINSFLDYNM